MGIRSINFGFEHGSHGRFGSCGHNKVIGLGLGKRPQQKAKQSIMKKSWKEVF